MKRTGTLRSAVFALGVAGTLGFGATQAMAAPDASPRASSCYPECESQCGPSWGYPLRNGVCVCCDNGGAAAE
jgi:hypothetical protein